MTPQIPQHSRPTAAWDGYTIDQLRYRRALTLARIEMEKEKAAADYERVRQGNVSMPGSLFTRLTGMLGFADYVVLAIKLLRRIAPLLRRHRK